MTVIPIRTDYFGYALAIVGTVLFATKGIFIKLAYQHGVSPETVLALRMLVAVPVYLVILFVLLKHNLVLRQALTQKSILGAMLAGILGYYVSSYLDFVGLFYLTAQMERLVLFTYPFFTLLFGIWFFGDKASWRVVPGMILSYIGLTVIFGWSLVINPEGLWLGTALVLAAAIFYALYQHLAKRQMALIGAGFFTCIAMCSAGIFAILHHTIAHGVSGYFTLSAEVWAYGLGLGILGTVLPSFLMNSGIHRIGARAASTMGVYGPLFTIAFAVTVLDEPFTIYHAAGTAMVLAGSAWFAQEEKKFKAR